MLGYILHRFTWMKNSEIAEFLNRTPAAVTMARARIAKRLPSDEELAHRVAEIEQQLRSAANQVRLKEDRKDPDSRPVLEFKI